MTTSSASTGVFISYRRDDTAAHAGRLCDRLRSHFGDGRVFMDFDTIPLGSDFVEVIDRAIASCGALVAIIGRDWAVATNAAGRRRLDDPADFVRREIAAGLARGVLLVPMLVEGATMPAAADLPADIALLARRNALEVTDSRWDYDVGMLITALETAVSPSSGGPSSGGPSSGGPSSGGPSSGGPPSSSPNYPPTPPPPPPEPLERLLPGNWNVQLQNPMGIGGAGSLMLDPRGVFQGQIASPMGMLMISGQWQIVGLNVVQLAGTQSNGFQMLPYLVIVQFTSVSPHALVGVTQAGESVAFSRVG